MDEVYELLDYLPIEDTEVNDYVVPLFNSAQVTYEKEEYQFSYFAIHLIFMTYIYLTVWKISQFHKKRFEHSLLFARPHNDKKKEDLKEVDSIFEYSHLPEKDIFEFFSLIGVDAGYIGNIKKFIDTRNKMAHATGRLQILNQKNFDDAISELLSVCSNIQNKMNETIKEWYKDRLTDFAKSGAIDEYEIPADFIDEVLIGSLSFSKKDFSACAEYGISRFSKREDYTFTPEEITRLQQLHKAVKAKYKEQSDT